MPTARVSDWLGALKIRRRPVGSICAIVIAGLVGVTLLTGLSAQAEQAVPPSVRGQVARHLPIARPRPRLPRHDLADGGHVRFAEGLRVPWVTLTSLADATSAGNFTQAVYQALVPTAGAEPIAVTVAQSGAFSVTVAPGPVALTPVTPPTTPDHTANGTLPSVTVQDGRNYYPGWSVVGQDSNFTGSGSAAGKVISGDALGWTPTVDGSLADHATLGGTVPPAGGNAGSTGPGLGSTAATLASATPGNGFGTTVLSANLLLDIPAGAVADSSYTSSLTITYLETGP